ncbi:MAG: response regulator [Clostridiales bacterium]|nr:response regulator [Clostridiales bacterium]
MNKVKVLLADDEPFITKGLQMLIDWEAEGCEIAAICDNGAEALKVIESKEIDLAIVDIRMPEMNGLDLIKNAKERYPDLSFVILSGYNDFEYAQKALRLGVTDYLLKPVKVSQLYEIVRNTVIKKNSVNIEEEYGKHLKRVCLVQYILNVLSGNSNPDQIEFIRDNIDLEDELNFIHITLNDIKRLEEMTDEEVFDLRQKVNSRLASYLGDFKEYLLPEAAGFEDDYEIGFILPKRLYESRGISKNDFLEELRRTAMQELGIDIILLVGKTMNGIEGLERSYVTACNLRSYRSFRSEKHIYCHDEDIHVPHTQAKAMIYKESMDDLISAVSRHDNDEIDRCLNLFFEKMENIKLNDKMINMNVDYLLFQMLHLAVEIDETVEQDKILLYISDDVFVQGKGFKERMKTYVHEYADFLDQLRSNSEQGGYIKEIESYIKSHYAENLTLRDLGKKYFVNSSYLGQIFRKKYGMSFKDYLNNYRIRMASEILVKSDKRVSDIAIDVGYRDTDYFVSKFIEVNGMTPTKFRRNSQNK